MKHKKYKYTAENIIETVLITVKYKAFDFVAIYFV